MREDGDGERKKEKGRGERKGGCGTERKIGRERKKEERGEEGREREGVLQYYEQFCFRAQDYLDYIATNNMTMT